MNPADPTPGSRSPDGATHEIAADWIARRDRGFTSAEASAFARWCAADPRHATALHRAEATRQLLSHLPEAPGAAAMLAEIEALCQSRRRIIRFPLLWTAAATVAAAACVALVFFLTSRPALDAANATYTTAAGEHQSIHLPDGSTLALNPGSQVQVNFAPAERRVRLQQGEAHFQVAKDPARPFLVSAGIVTVRAVGTAFRVRRQVAAVEVVVTEGRVKVSRSDPTTPAAAELEPIYLGAGERAFIDSVPAAALAARPLPATDDATAQRAPRLMFNNTPLSDVVARFNRYNRVQMEIADPDLAHRSVGGNFDADNAESFINLLSAAGDVRVERLSEHRVLLHKVP